MAVVAVMAVVIAAVVAVAVNYSCPFNSLIDQELPGSLLNRVIFFKYIAAGDVGIIDFSDGQGKITLKVKPDYLKSFIAGLSPTVENIHLNAFYPLLFNLVYGWQNCTE